MYFCSKISCVYISTPGENVLLDYFHAYLCITFSEREGEGFSIFWEKSKIILAVNFFSADEIFRNRKKYFEISAVLLKIDLFSLFWNFLEISYFQSRHFQKCVLIDISSPRKL